MRSTPKHDTTPHKVGEKARDGTIPVEGPADNSDALGHNHEPTEVIDGGLDGRVYAGNRNVDPAETDPDSVFNQAAISRSDAAENAARNDGKTAPKAKAHSRT